MAITIINKGNAEAPRNPHPDQLWVDHETGLIHRPGQAPVELSGPTTGSEYEQLKEREKQNAKLMHLLKRQMLSTYQCTQCRRKFSGKLARIKWRQMEGVNAETLVCPDSTCDGPVIMVEDARDLRSVPGGKV